MIDNQDIRDWVIYKITSPNDKIYIGKTVRFSSRMSSYRCLRCKEQPYLYHSLSKYGFNNHKIEKIDKFTSNNNYAGGKEMFWIKSYMSNFKKYPDMGGLNLTDGGDGLTGYVPSEETRKKMSDKKKGKIPHNKGKKMSPEAFKALQEGAKKHREKYGVHNRGKSMSDEQKKKVSESKKGSTYNKGRVHTKSSIQKFKKNLEKARLSKCNRRAVLVFDLNNNFISKYETIKDCAKALGVNRTTVGRNLEGLQKSRKKYIFKYKDYISKKKKQ